MSYKITILENDLYDRRIKEVTDLVKIVKRNDLTRAMSVPSGNPNSRIISVSEKNLEMNRFREGRFSTIVTEFSASYYEIWTRQADRIFALERAYFHLYREADDGEEKEYILFHCDPIEKDETHGDYRNSPHLHIKATDDSRISHAHIAINLTDIGNIMKSREDLTKALKTGIKMLKEQILDEWT